MNLRFAIFIFLAMFLPMVALASGQLEISVVDADTGLPIAVRMHLKNAQGRPIKPPGLPTLGDHFVFNDKILLKLPNGGYEFLMERGNEYLEQRGHFEIQNFADDRKIVPMKRFVDMAKDGWFSGDLDVDRQEKDIQLLMRGDDVHVVPLITWTNKKNPWTNRPLPKTIVNQFDGTFFNSLLGGALLAPGNTLRLFRLEKPIDLSEPSPSGRGQGEGASTNLPSGALTPAFSQAEREKILSSLGSLPWLPAIEKARREQNAWVDAGAFFARDLPIWIAAGQIDSIQLANRHLEREGIVDNEAGGWPRDISSYSKPWGNGRWSVDIYYHLLECGLRIPPTAGSGSGENNNPVGYNRLYVHLGADLESSGRDPAEPSPSGRGQGEGAAGYRSTNTLTLALSQREREKNVTWDRWWDGLRAGRVIVTNGPLIRPNVEGHPPGYVFKGDAGQPVELLTALTLSTRDKIRYLDIVQNGQTVYDANLDEFKEAGGKLPPVKFTDSGWFLIRAITENTQTFRYATTAPYYVEVGYKPRVSRKSAQFFLDWTNKRAGEISKAIDAVKPTGDQASAGEAAAVKSAQQYIEQAQAYWKGILDKATVD